ncbi:hypothetical protein D3C75_1303540 [compost metagenome]
MGKGELRLSQFGNGFHCAFRVDIQHRHVGTASCKFVHHGTAHPRATTSYNHYTTIIIIHVINLAINNIASTAN